MMIFCSKGSGVSSDQHATWQETSVQRCGRRSNFGLECLPIFGGGQMVRNGYGQVGNTHPSTKDERCQRI